MLDDAALHDALVRCPPRSAEVVSRVGLDGWDLVTLARRYGVSDAAAAVLLLRAARDFRATVERHATPAPPLPDVQETSLAAQLAAALAAGSATAASDDGTATGASPAPAVSGAPPGTRATSAGATTPATGATAPGHATGPPAGLGAAPEVAAVAGTVSGVAPPAAATVDPSVRPLADALAALWANRDAVQRRLRDAEAEAARSPARAREAWLRRLAILLILALTAWFYWRERQAPPPRPPPVAPR